MGFGSEVLGLYWVMGLGFMPGILKNGGLRRRGAYGGSSETTGNWKGYDSGKLTVRTIGGCNLRDVYELQTELLSKNLSSATITGKVYYLLYLG